MIIDVIIVILLVGLFLTALHIEQR